MEPTEVTVTAPKKSNRKLIVIILILIVAAAIAAVAIVNNRSNGSTKSAPTTQPTPDTATVRITNSGFEPAALNVKANTVVIWVNARTDKAAIVAANPYPAGEDTQLKSSQLGQGASYRYQFKESGSFGYHDELNPTMNGTIVVK